MYVSMCLHVCLVSFSFSPIALTSNASYALVRFCVRVNKSVRVYA